MSIPLPIPDIPYQAATFTPVLEGSGTAGNFRYSVQTASNIRLGNAVRFRITIELSSVGSPTPVGDMRITGLPFTASIGMPQAVNYFNMTFGGGYTQVLAEVVSGTNRVDLLIAGSAQGKDPLPHTAIGNTTGISIQGTYFTSLFGGHTRGSQPCSSRSLW